MARILVVDDDEAIRDSLAAALGRSGHEVRTARDGRQGILGLETFSADLVITDINMPEMDGIEVITGLRESRPGVPIIAISGGGRVPADLLLDNADWLGAIRTIAKPIDLVVLTRAVEEALRSDPQT